MTDSPESKGTRRYCQVRHLHRHHYRTRCPDHRYQYQSDQGY